MNHPFELLLLRHGKSDWEQPLPDFSRPLKDRGKRDAQRMGVWLAQHHLIPERIITSTAERARTTAEKCAKSMGAGTSIITHEPRIYEAAPSQLLSLLQELAPDLQRVMLVGHNPGFEGLLQLLSREQPAIPADGKLMPTATLAHLSFSTPWSTLQPHHGQLIQLIRPRTLPATFPYPDVHGSGRRKRPAYYYTQSSVIPYRISETGLEILITRSSKGKHWVVPKGIQEPGNSPQASAAKEAREEAGVIGDVGDESLGQYRYRKWGADCSVTVFPMRVTGWIADEAWKEAHRGRQWVTLQQAQAQLKQVELIPMIEKLSSQVGSDHQER